MSFAVYLITPDATPTIAARVEAALALAPPGEVAVQLRDKSAGPAELADAATALRGVTRRAGAPLYVNGSIEVARAVGADGVHLPEAAGPPSERCAGLSVGISRHDHAGLVTRAGGADFATLAPVGRVEGKGAPLGVRGLRVAIEGAPLPVYALGGIDLDLARAIGRTGARGVAVIRAVFDAPDPAAALRDLCATVAEWPPKAAPR